MYKIDGEGNLLCFRFFEKFTKIDLADNIAKRCQRDQMNKKGTIHQIPATLAE